MIKTCQGHIIQFYNYKQSKQLGFDPNVLDSAQRSTITQGATPES